jgi:hypothetical protein
MKCVIIIINYTIDRGSKQKKNSIHSVPPGQSAAHKSNWREQKRRTAMFWLDGGGQQTLLGAVIFFASLI